MKEMFGGQGADEKPADLSRRKFLERAVVAGAVVVGVTPEESKAESFVGDLNEMRAEVRKNDNIISFLKCLNKDDISSFNDYFVVSPDDYAKDLNKDAVIGGGFGVVVGAGIGKAIAESKGSSDRVTVPTALTGGAVGTVIGLAVATYDKKEMPEVIRRLPMYVDGEYLRNTFFAEKELLTPERILLEMKRLENINAKLLLKIKGE